MKAVQHALLTGVLALSAGFLVFDPAVAEERAAGTHTAALPSTFLPSKGAGVSETQPLPKIQLALLGILTQSGTDALEAGAPEAHEAIRQAYAKRVYRPLWLDAEGLTPRGESLLRAIEDAGEDGLNPDDYAAEARQAALTADEATPEAQARLDLQLTAALLSFLSDLKIGRVEPSSIDGYHDIERKPLDRAALLEGAAEAESLIDFVAAQRPQSAAYARLRQALRDYRRLATVQADTLVPSGPTLRPGESDPRVPLLRERLAQIAQVANVLPGPTSSLTQTLEPAAYSPEPEDLFDPTLEEAVMDFQKRHGLEVDGIVGKKTREALNASLAERAAQILVNLERLRWLPEDLGAHHVAVNLPDYRMRVVRDGAVVHEARVIIGTRKNRTPLFSDEITYLEFNPFWNVPRSIAGEEILPELRKDPGYLAANDFTLLSDWGEESFEIDPYGIVWDEVSPKSFPFRVRQGPGTHNALGLVKFMFPNRHSVYMHDTPAKSLFSKTYRAFSHGCIRVQHPDEFAKVLLDWSDEELDEVMGQSDRRIVSLKTPIPVHLTYMTAWLADDGTVQFREDLYGNDKSLARALLGGRDRTIAHN